MSFSFRGNATSLLFLILFLILRSDLAGASVSSSIKDADLSCNGTSAKCFLDSNMESEGEEFLRHHAAGGRWLLSQQTNTIGFKSLQPPPVCNTPQYGNCIVLLKNANARPCTDYNQCHRQNPN